MRVCKTCKVSRQIHQYYENSNGNLAGSCKFCITARQKLNYHYVKKANERERQARIDQNLKRDKDALAGKRPCAIFQGYLFSGDVA